MQPSVIIIEFNCFIRFYLFKLTEEFSKVKGKKVLKFNPESDLTEYLQLYSDLAQ
jgi:hypothetical protein